jgi:hypothetical protein
MFPNIPYFIVLFCLMQDNFYLICQFYQSLGYQWESHEY